MKRKIFPILFAFVAVFAVCSLSACNSASNKLQIGKKYISTSDVGNDGEQSYYVFHSDGTGEYKCYDIYASDSLSEYNYDYTIHFIYTFADEDNSAIVCFYDSVEYGAKQGTYRVSTNWTALLTVSENVLCRTSSYGYSFFINEEYIKNIPNFNS